VSGQDGPVVCLSYLAAASLWSVPTFPQANRGAEIFAVEQSIAADGPMVAATLSALGVPGLLLSNNVGDDAPGAEVRHWLWSHGFHARADVECDGDTPQITVVADTAGTRTWFTRLPRVTDALNRLDLDPLQSASFVYIDAYQLIQAPAARAVCAARTVDVPLLLNLGGSPLSPDIADAACGHPRLIVQTNVDDDDFAEADRIAPPILDNTKAAWVIITAGASGVLAFSLSERAFVPAFHAEVRHTHCAGAAFSGALIYGLVHGWPMADSLTLASASGALRCERAHDEPLPTLPELRAVTASRGRLINVAATG
jgi:sugar/nucleoside kinase (ribokinase family)